MVLGVGLAGLAATPAQADEQYFGYTYSSEVLPKGRTEAELWVTDRRGKDEGHFDAQDYRLELEHGFTDRLTVAGYANFAGLISGAWTTRISTGTSPSAACRGNSNIICSAPTRTASA